MKHLFVCLATGVYSICFSTAAFAGENHFFQQPARDTFPAVKIEKLTVTVKDLMDGEGLDSVYVTVGNKKGYTDGKGIISLDSIPPGSMVYASKNGYLAQSTKAKADIVFRLGKKRIFILCKAIQQWSIPASF